MGWRDSDFWASMGAAEPAGGSSLVLQEPGRKALPTHEDP